MKCPKCELINPDSAVQCDCGFNFASGRMDQVGKEKPVKHSIGENIGLVIGSCILAAGFVVMMLSYFLHF